MTLSLKEIMTTYEACRHWYKIPHVIPKTSKRISNIREALKNIDLVLLDSYGVLCRGSEVIPEALDMIQFLRQNNVPFCVVSNDTMNGRKTVEKKYSKLGFDFKKEEVVTSLDVTENFLKKEEKLNNWVATGYADNPIKNEFPDIKNLNAKEGNLTPEIENLMFLVGAGWQENWQRNLEDSASDSLQKIALANPDVGAPTGNVFVATPGYYAHQFYKNTNFKNKPILLGKPDPVIFEYALEFKGFKGKAEKVLMVGDSLHTDILGGLNMGFKTLLVESGIFINGEAEDYIQKTGIVPHYIAPHV